MKEITLIKQAEINCKLHNILENETVFLNKEKTSLPFFNDSVRLFKSKVL